jgi:hypothetical protein
MMTDFSVGVGVAEGGGVAGLFAGVDGGIWQAVNIRMDKKWPISERAVTRVPPTHWVRRIWYYLLEVIFVRSKTLDH